MNTLPSSQPSRPTRGRRVTLLLLQVTAVESCCSVRRQLCIPQAPSAACASAACRLRAPARLPTRQRRPPRRRRRARRRATKSAQRSRRRRASPRRRGRLLAATHRRRATGASSWGCAAVDPAAAQKAHFSRLLTTPSQGLDPQLGLCPRRRPAANRRGAGAAAPAARLLPQNRRRRAPHRRRVPGNRHPLPPVGRLSGRPGRGHRFCQGRRCRDRAALDAVRSA